MEDELLTRDQILTILKDNLKVAQDRMKSQADKHRLDKTFAVGDWVYLKLQPYKQISVAYKRVQKLSPLYYGPYQVLERIGPVAYKLSLPPTSRIHSTFHISQLKAFLGPHVQVSMELPGIDSTTTTEPLHILDCRARPTHGRLITEALVQWSDSAPEDAQWEDYWSLVRRFPNFDVENRRAFQEGGIDTTLRQATVDQQAQVTGRAELQQLNQEEEGEDTTVSTATSNSSRTAGSQGLYASPPFNEPTSHDRVINNDSSKRPGSEDGRGPTQSNSQRPCCQLECIARYKR